MNKLLYIVIAALALFARPLAGRAQDVPAKPDPPRLVNDLAHVMTPDQVSTLEHKLTNYDDSTSNQIVIVTLPTIGDADIQEYSVRLFRAWGVGNKKTNNGVLVLVAIDKHQVWITTGYGLEGAIPDVTAKAIINNEIVPNFRSSTGDNYYRGFDQAADALIKAAAGEYKATDEYANRGRQHALRRSRGGNAIGIFFIIFIIIIIAIFRRGGGGGGGGGYFGGGGFLPFLLGTMVGRGLGGGGGGGGDWGGGGGGDSGGGFGGFGGGDTGGGGAGGSW